MTIDAETVAFAHRLADAAGAVIRPYFRKRIDVVDKGGTGPKPIFDPVTEADQRAEDVMRALIHKERPDDGILGEERGHEPGTSGRTWILDPIDGTRPFITGRHTWGTLIALAQDGKPLFGMIDQPVLRERFTGDGKTAQIATLEGTVPLKVRPCSSLSTAVVSTTHPWAHFSRAQRVAFENVCNASRMSYFGGDCYAYGLVAMGFIDLMIEGRLAPWDVAALIPIIEGAGGAVTDWDGQPFVIGASVVAAGDRRALAQAVDILKGQG